MCSINHVMQRLVHTGGLGLVEYHEDWRGDREVLRAPAGAPVVVVWRCRPGPSITRNWRHSRSAGQPDPSRTVSGWRCPGMAGRLEGRHRRQVVGTGRSVVGP